MTAGMMFWVIWLVAVLFSGYCFYRDPGSRWNIGGSVIVFILLALLGWKTFGPLLQ